MSPIQALPKVDLHRHLELSLRAKTIWDLAPGAGIHLKSQEDFQERFLILEPMKDLGAVLNKFLDTQKLLSTPEILERIAYEACIDAYREDNIRLLELRYAPTFVAQGHKLTFEQIHEAFVRGIARAESEVPIAVGLICIIQRILPLKDSERVVDFAIQNKATFLGLDLADNEEGFDAKPFAPVFKRAAAAGLKITVHSAEAPSPLAGQRIRDAVEGLGATRIGHGVQVYRDEKAMQYAKDRGLVFELCPTSNLLTHAVPSLKEHPLKKMFDYGLRTTINTDDPGIFNTNSNREFRIARDEIGLSESDLAKCAQFAAEASFIHPEKKKKVWPAQ